MSIASKFKFLSQKPLPQLCVSSQYTGIGILRLSQVPPLLRDYYDKKLDLQGIPSLIAQLDDFSVDSNYDADACVKLLKSIIGKLTNFEARRNQDDSESCNQYNKWCKMFINNGGIEVLTRLVVHTSLVPSQSLIYDNDSEDHLRVKSICLETICKIISYDIGESVAKTLCKHEDNINYIFTLLVHDKTCFTACQYLEDMLQARKSVLNLSSIPNLKQLISSLDDQKLANFCRVLAVTISDLDIYENKSSLFAQNKQKRSKGFVNIRDLNQELLLSITDLLPRLINIACVRNLGTFADTPRYRGMQSELDCWMEWIENSMADAAFDTPTDDDLDEFIGGVSAPTSATGPIVQQSGLKISNDLILRVQVVYVLGLFLVGKQRKKVQRKLAELKLVPGLSELFDQFIWKCQVHRNNSRHRLRGHNASCECSPEVALKIQFLRLVHSFCDHSEYKHLLLSKSELNEIKRINLKAGSLQIDGLENINKNFMCRGSKGLLTKIVAVMKKEPTASTFRFWLARAVESYLRGSTSYCDQIFLLRRGLLQHIAGNIVQHDVRPKEIIQSSFDLLGELIKFNIEAFKTFDKVLNTKKKFDKFVEQVNKNLVDSNMFIRSLVLSFEFYCSVTPKYQSEFLRGDCRLLAYVSKFSQQLVYLQRLINLINVQNLTQENVSCLNTTMVILMFANQKEEMPKYLKALMLERSTSGDCITGVPLMKNFRDLLRFWQEHYLHKDKDCSALEKSSRISFDYWKSTVNLLVSDDRENESAIIYYIEPDMFRDS